MELFAFGENLSGQLGIKIKGEINKPNLIMKDETIKMICFQKKKFLV